MGLYKGQNGAIYMIADANLALINALADAETVAEDASTKLSPLVAAEQSSSDLLAAATLALANAQASADQVTDMVASAASNSAAAALAATDALKKSTDAAALADASNLALTAAQTAVTTAQGALGTATDDTAMVAAQTALNQAYTDLAAAQSSANTDTASSALLKTASDVAAAAQAQAVADAEDAVASQQSASATFNTAKAAYDAALSAHATDKAALDAAQAVYDSAADALATATVAAHGCPKLADITAMTDDDVTAWQDSMAPSLEQAQTNQVDLINQAYSAAAQVDVSFTTAAGVTKTFQADCGGGTGLDSQSVLLKTVTGYGAVGSVPDGFAWKSTDNTMVPFTLNDLFGLYAAMLESGAAAFAKKTLLKAQIAAATTVTAVQALTWDSVS